MHTGTVVAENRLRHEGSGLAIRVGHIVHDIFVQLHVVSALHHGVELDTEFVLRWCNLVVMLLDRNTDAGQNADHFGAEVRHAVNRANREVTAFWTRAVAEVAVREFAAAVVWAFFRVDLVHDMVLIDLDANIVKDEEFGFRTEERGVTDTGRSEIGFSRLGGGAWVAGIWLTG